MDKEFRDIHKAKPFRTMKEEHTFVDSKANSRLLHWYLMPVSSEQVAFLGHTK